MQWAECGVSVVFFFFYYKFVWATARYTQDGAHNSRREWCILMRNLNALSTYIAHRTLYVPINRWAFNPMMIAASKLRLVGSCLFALLSNVLWIAAKIQMNQHTINSHLGRLDPRSPQLNCVNYARYAFAVHFACAMKLKIVKKIIHWEHSKWNNKIFEKNCDLNYKKWGFKELVSLHSAQQNKTFEFKWIHRFSTVINFGQMWTFLTSRSRFVSLPKFIAISLFCWMIVKCDLRN